MTDAKLNENKRTYRFEGVVFGSGMFVAREKPDFRLTVAD